MMLSFLQYCQTLEEQALKFNGQVKPRFGQVVFLAGGGRQGKGYVIDKMVILDAKKYDVDEIKKKIVSDTRYQEFVKKYHKELIDELGIDVSNLDLKNPEDVSKLHALVAKSGLDKRPRQELQKLLTSLDDKSRYPNLIFDVTFKNKAKTLGQAKELVEAGYDPKNIHIVWALNSLENALANNRRRARSVSDEIIKKAAHDVAVTMRSLFDDAEVQATFNGDWYFVFSNQTGIWTKSSKGRSIAQDYVQVKRSGQRPNLADIEGAILDRIKDLAPEWKDE